VSLPVQARVLSNGSPQNNAQVNFSIVSGSGSLSAASASTDPNGYAAVTVSFSNFAAMVSVNACVAPSNARCAIFSANPTPREQLVLQQVSGAGQISTGAPFQPVTVRVMDSAPVPHPVLAAPVSFLTTVMRSGGSVPGTGVGDTNSGNPSMPVVLKVTLTNATSDGNGLASITPSSGDFSAPVEVDVSAAAGTTAFLDNPLLLLPAPSVISSSQSSVAVKNHPGWGSGR
jgi:hypothetical protein